MFRLLSKLTKFTNIECVSLGIMDFYQMVHNVPTIKELDIPEIMEIRTQDDMYKSWQVLQEDGEKLKKIDLVLWEKTNCIEGGRTLSEIQMGNALTNQWEREKYWLPYTKYWEERVLTDTIIWCENYLKEFQPDIVICLERYELAQSIMQELCRTQKIKTLTFITSRIGNRWIARRDFGYGTSEDTKIEIEEAASNPELIIQAQNLAEELRSRFKGAYDSAAYNETVRSLKMQKNPVKYFLRDLRKLAGDIYSRHVVGPKRMTVQVVRFGENQIHFTLLKIRRLLISYIHASGIKFWGSKKLPKEPYFFWALHARPEASVLVLGDGRDELDELRKFLKLVPPGHVLAVKENPEMFGMRKNGFYSELKSEPNIYLVDPYADTSYFVRNSVGVIGISGTVLLEAALLDKPVCALGRPEFEACLTYHGWNSAEIFISDYNLNQLKTDMMTITQYLAYVLSKSDIRDVKYDSDLNSEMMEVMINRFSLEVFEYLSKTK